jgi:hypothetical protein
MDSAASLPCAMASIAVFGPVTASPPEKIPLTVVSKVMGFTLILPSWCVLSLLFFEEVCIYCLSYRKNNGICLKLLC